MKKSHDSLSPTVQAISLDDNSNTEEAGFEMDDNYDDLLQAKEGVASVKQEE